MKPHPTPNPVQWLAAQEDHVQDIFLERAFPPEDCYIILLDTRLAVYREFPMVREQLQQVRTRSEGSAKRQRVRAAIRLGLVVAPPIVGPDDIVIDGLNRLVVHAERMTDPLPIYHVYNDWDEAVNWATVGRAREVKEPVAA